VIYFNGNKIADCGRTNPTTPSNPVLIPSYLLATPGFNSSAYNLANDFYFFSQFIDEKYFKKSPFPAIYYIPSNK
jgi:hypothetical protein